MANVSYSGYRLVTTLLSTLHLKHSQQVKSSFMFFKTVFHVLLLSTSLIIVIVMYTCQYFISGSVFPRTVTEITDFRHQWCRLQTWRVDWDSMLNPCRGQMSWDQRDVTSRKRTSSYKSYISKWEISPAGHFSRFWIQSVDMDGNPKIFGGDSWKLYIRQGPASLSPIVIDHNNGLYEALFLVTEPGVYYAGLYLDYTLCNGYRDPPRKFFRNGTNQGIYVNIDEDFLGDISADFINKPLSGKTAFKMTIEPMVPSPPGLFAYCHDNESCTVLTQTCQLSCQHMWDGHGRWINGTWKSFSPVTLKNHHPYKPEALLHIGDSNARRFMQYARKADLCKRVFKKCHLVQNWLYEYEMDRTSMTNTDEFNKTYVLDLFQRKLRTPDINNQASVFLFNLGIHYSLGLNFSQFADIVTSVIDLLKEKHSVTGRPRYKVDMVWRGTTMIERQKLLWNAKAALNATLFRFHNNHRIQLFHSYATKVMCQAGFKVLDMYHLTASYPKGTYDNVHYDFEAYAPAVNILERYYG